MELIGFIRKINSWVEHPNAPEAAGVIHAIENIHPHFEGLISKLEPEPGSRSCKSTSRKPIKRDFSSRSAFLSLFDLVDNTLCSVNDIRNNVRDNILNDVKSNVKDLQNAVDNLSQEAGPYKTPLSLQANRLRTHQLHRYLALRQQQSAIAVSFATYQPYPLLPYLALPLTILHSWILVRQAQPQPPLSKPAQNPQARTLWRTGRIFLCPSTLAHQV